MDHEAKIPTGSEELLQVDGSNGGMSATVGVTLAVQRPPGNHLLLGKNSLVTIFRQDDKILPNYFGC